MLGVLKILEGAEAKKDSLLQYLYHVQNAHRTGTSLGAWNVVYMPEEDLQAFWVFKTEVFEN